MHAGRGERGAVARRGEGAPLRGGGAATRRGGGGDERGGEGRGSSPPPQTLNPVHAPVSIESILIFFHVFCIVHRLALRMHMIM